MGGKKKNTSASQDQNEHLLASGNESPQFAADAASINDSQTLPSSSSFVPVGIMAHAGDLTKTGTHDFVNDDDSDFITDSNDSDIALRRTTSSLHVGNANPVAASLHSTNNSHILDDGTKYIYSPDGRKLTWSEMDWSQRLRYLSYYFPVTVWLPQYDKKNLPGDLIAGLSIGAMMIPQSMAYAGILGIPPIFGLITGLFPQFIYFILGHSNVLTTGAEATTCILLAESIRSLPDIVAAHNEGKDIAGMIQAAASAISLLAGIFTLLLGIFRLGFVDGVFSRPVLSGFVCAVGMLLLIDQTPKVLGLPKCEDCDELTHRKIAYLFKNIFLEGNIHWLTCAIGVSCILFLAIFKQLKNKFPSSVALSRVPHIFIMVIIITILSYSLDFKSSGVKILGSQNAAFPTPRLPTFSSGVFSNYLSIAIILSILGFVETQLVNKVSNVKGTTISPNRELVALGTIHVVNSFFGGFTAFGSLTRTKVAIQAGCTSQISALVAGSMILLAALFLMPFFAYMPVAVTGGIIFFVALSLLETHDLFFTFKMKEWVDFSLNVAMIIITFFFGVDIGLFFAFACCLLLVVKQQNKPAVRLLGRVTTASNKSDARSAVEILDGTQQGAASNSTEAYYEYEQSTALTNEELEGILIYQIDGPLVFSNSEGLRDRTRRIEYQGSFVSHPSEPVRPLTLKCIIFEMTAVTYIDATAAQVLLEIIGDYKKRGVRVVFVKVRKALQPSLENAGILAALGMDNVLKNVDAAITVVQRENPASAPTMV